MISQVTEQMPRPRRFSFSRQRPQDIPLKSEPPPVTTLGFPIDALPLYTETLSKERREICVSPTWNRESKSRGRSRRSQSVDPTGHAEHPTVRHNSRRLVKKPPTKRDPSVSSGTTRFSNVPLISSISTRIRSRRSSMSNNAAGGDMQPTLPFVDPAIRMSTEAPPAAPHLSATLPPAFGETISKDLMKGPSAGLTAGQYSAHPSSGQKEAPRMNGYPVSQQQSVEEKKQPLRRAGARFYHTSPDDVSRPRPSNAANNPRSDGLKARETNNKSDRKEITLPDSLRVGRSKVIEPGPKSPKRALAKKETNPPKYNLPKPSSPTVPQSQEQKQDHSTAQSMEKSHGGNASSPKCPNCLEPFASKHATDKVETDSQQNENQVPAPLFQSTQSPQPSPEHNASISIESAVYNSPTLVTDSPAVSNPDTTEPLHSLPRTPNPETTKNTSSLTEFSTWSGPNASSRGVEAKNIPRNTTSPRQDKYLAKIFVVCCQCNFWHDIPSGLYVRMIFPDGLLFSNQSDFAERRSSSQARDSGYQTGSRKQSFTSQQSTSAENSKNTVQCCWCAHEMAKTCCTGWTTMVHLLEKHH